LDKNTPEFSTAKKIKLSNAQKVLFRETSKDYSSFSINGAACSAADEEGKRIQQNCPLCIAGKQCSML
jgi:hypothetical protein